LRLAPAQVRAEVRRRNWRAAVAFPTGDVIHRPEFELTRAVSRETAAGIVLMAVVDPASRELDRERFTTLRCHRKVLARYDDSEALLWLVDIAARRDPGRDVLLRAVVARNAGCTHVLLARELPADVKEVVTEFARRAGVAIVIGAETYPRQLAAPRLRREDARRLMSEGRPLPEWYTFPEVASELLAGHPPRHRRGFTVFFTGLSGSGKSTIANIVRVRLLEHGRSVTLLDGDLVRKHLSPELGFSREHRALNIQRIAFVASEITKHGGIAICAPIAPYEAGRREARDAIEAVGGFVLVFVDTPLDTCERRDRKGLYAKARAGLIREFTGISDAYERPVEADVVLQTSELSPEASANAVIDYLRNEGYLEP
jgi:sulfate adenylyltransferase